MTNNIQVLTTHLYCISPSQSNPNIPGAFGSNAHDESMPGLPHAANEDTKKFMCVANTDSTHDVRLKLGLTFPR